MKSDEKAAAAAAEALYRFGDFRLDAVHRRVLRLDGTGVELTARVYDTLLHLVLNPDRLVTKRELMDAVWGQTIVEENNLAQSISALRRALGERPDEHRYIVTVSGRGYRFIAPVTRESPGADTPQIERSARHEPPPRGERRPQGRGVGRRIVILTVAIVAVIATAWLWRMLAPRGEPALQSIAVLPFRPLMTGDTRDAAFELGMTDTLITQLSASGAVIVRPLSSVRRYADLDQDPLEAGRALAVDAVLDANIQRADAALRVTLRLTRVGDGVALWTDKVDQPIGDVFAMQDAIAERVVRALTLRLTGEQRERLMKRYTANADAYRLYVLGRYHWSRLTPPEIAKSIDYFQQAIGIDASYALAYAGLAEAYRALPITSDMRSTDLLPLGKAAARRALEIDPSLDDALATLCFIETWFDWDWSTAEKSCRRALALNPNGADAHRALAILLSSTARHDEAVVEARLARELDPLSLLTNAIEAHVLLYAGKIDAAEARLQATLALSKDFWIAHLFLGRTHLARGAFEDALAELELARELSGGNSESISLIGYTHAISGSIRGANAMLDELIGADGYVPPVNVAMIYNGLGDDRRALEWLRRAYHEHDVRLTWLKVEPKWNPLRDEPEFVVLMRDMHL